MSFSSMTGLMLGLESRTLFSHGGHDVLPKLTSVLGLDGDRAAIMADVTKFKADVEAARVGVTKAINEQKGHVAAADAKLKTLAAETVKDTLSMKAITTKGEADLKAAKLKWSSTISADELDVKVVSEGETEQDRGEDAARLAQHRAQAKMELMEVERATRQATESLKAEVKGDVAAVDAARKAAAVQLAADAKAVQAAVKRLQSVFQSDKAILEADLQVFRSHGGVMATLNLPALPKL